LAVVVAAAALALAGGSDAPGHAAVHAEPRVVTIGATRQQVGRQQVLIARARLAAEGSRRYLPWYSRYVFDAAPAPHHMLIANALQAVHDGLVKRLIVIAPPGHAKSTYGSIMFPTWHLGNRPGDSIIGATTTDRLARIYNDSAAGIMEWSRDYRTLFPDVRPDRTRGWSSDGLYLTRPLVATQKDPSLVYVGAGGAIIGRRADGVIIDDVVDEGVARSSDVKLPARLNWVRRSVLSRLKPGGWAVVLGTVWTEGDVVSTLSDEGDWAIVRFRALSGSRMVTADVTLPDDCRWAPTAEWPEVRSMDMEVHLS
jgi:hypothetical protein